MTDKLPLPLLPKQQAVATKSNGIVWVYLDEDVQAYGRECQRLALEAAAKECERIAMRGTTYTSRCENAIRRMIEELK